MSQDFEFTKEGFKLSYQRYLSDGITGLMFISFFIIAFIKQWELPFLGHKWRTVFPNSEGTGATNSVGTEVQIAFLIFLFLIAPSIGITLNALGWFLLGTASVWLIWVWEKFPKYNYFVMGTNRKYDAKTTFRFFNVDNSSQKTTDSSESLYDVARSFEQLLIFHFPIYHAPQIAYIRGLTGILRTTSFLLFLLAMYFWTVHHDIYLGGLCFLSSFFFLLYTSLNEYYQSVKILFLVYSLVKDKFLKTNPKNKSEIARVLSEMGAKE